MTEVTPTYIPDTPAELAAGSRPKIGLSDSEYSSKRLDVIDLILSGEGVVVTVSSATSVIDKFATADEIAAFFKATGVKGDRNILDSCPISSYYKAQAPNVKFETDNEGVYFVTKSGGQYRIRETPAMKEFVKNFDAGMYPELVR